MSKSDQFSAAAPMAGYLFQCRLALLIGLRLMRKKPNGQISIEKFDDIAFENEDYTDCLTQAKHHVNAKSLDDKSVDLWKTLRIWISRFNQGILEASDTQYLLITTAEAQTGSAMEQLRVDTNDLSVDKAHELLTDAAVNSNNKKTEQGREAYLALSDSEAKLFLSRYAFVINIQI